MPRRVRQIGERSPTVHTSPQPSAGGHQLLHYGGTFYVVFAWAAFPLPDAHEYCVAPEPAGSQCWTLVFFVVVAAMVFGRWVEQRSGQGVTMSGELSTWEDFRRYAILVLPLLAIALWIVANVLGNHWFQGNAGF